MKAPQRFIYVIGPLEGAQKVGLTTDPKARLATLQTASPHELVLHVAIRVPFGEAHAIERRAHRLMGPMSTSGEWFDVTPDAAMVMVLAAAKSHGQQAPPSETVVVRPFAAENLPLFAFERAMGNAPPPVQPARLDLWQKCRAVMGRR